jgi:hypothetical protein
MEGVGHVRRGELLRAASADGDTIGEIGMQGDNVMKGSLRDEELRERERARAQRGS